MATPAVTAAAAAAAAHQKMLYAEEEEMTKYTSEELDDGWEFKIVRSSTSNFSKPGALKRLLDEESQAGWIMLEKFDDNRVRFKRPRSAQARDAQLPPEINPYRTRYGPSDAKIALIIVAIVAIVLAAIIITRLLI